MRFALGLAPLVALALLCGFSGAGGSSGGSRERDHYWTHGCITSDGARLALVGDRTALVDLQTGAVTHGTVRFDSAVVCTRDGRALGIGSSDVVVIGDGTREPGRSVTHSRVVGVRSDGQIVLTHRPTTQERAGGLPIQRFTGPRHLGLASDHGERVEPGLELTPELFGLEGQPGGSLRAHPIGIVDGRDVLVAAGRGNVVPEHSEQTWRFYRVDPAGGAVTPLGPEHPTQRLTNPRDLRASASTPDAGTVAVTWRGEDHPRLEVFEIASPTPRCHAEPGGREVETVALSPDGSRVALGVSTGSRSRVVVLDAVTCEPVFQSESRRGRVFLVAFLEGGDVVWVRSDQHVERATATGEPVYSSP